MGRKVQPLLPYYQHPPLMLQTNQINQGVLLLVQPLFDLSLQFCIYFKLAYVAIKNCNPFLNLFLSPQCSFPDASPGVSLQTGVSLLVIPNSAVLHLVKQTGDINTCACLRRVQKRLYKDFIFNYSTSVYILRFLICI